MTNTAPFEPNRRKSNNKRGENDKEEVRKRKKQKGVGGRGIAAKCHKKAVVFLVRENSKESTTATLFQGLNARAVVAPHQGVSTGLRIVTVDQKRCNGAHLQLYVLAGHEASGGEGLVPTGYVTKTRTL